MAQKERYQNPVVGDTLRLRLHVFNFNAPAPVTVQQVDIYFLDPFNKSEDNPDGRRLVQSITDMTQVISDDVGEYYLDVSLDSPQYVIGKYFDVWTAQFSSNDVDEVATTSAHPFMIYPNLWYTTPVPVVYDFSFHFQPNKLRRGSIQYVMIEVVPNVPRANDLQQYYENLAIVADLKISMEQSSCGNCVPEEQDLRMILDEEPVDYREKRWGYYKLDTTEMEIGIYNVWFRLDFGGNVYYSDKMQFLIFE